MRAALALARRGLGQTWPNPTVGCVILRDGIVVGRGRTAPGGRPHAETEALAMAGDRARGATAYVTLEPCAHHGETPPCAQALIDAGLARVVVAASDPDPRVDGGGIAMLRAAGIRVDLGVCRQEAEEINAGFLCRLHKGRPMLTLKLATSLDGRIALASGESRWITGPQSRHAVHLARAQHDAIMVGSGTAKADDPMLDVRGMGPLPRPPVRIVTDTKLATPEHHRLITTAQDIPTWLVHTPHAPPARRAALNDAGATCIDIPGPSARLDLTEAMAALAARGLTRIFCEGGGILAASLLAADLVDRVMLFTAGKAIGATGIPALGALEFASLADTGRFQLCQTRASGADSLSLWTRHRQ